LISISFVRVPGYIKYVVSPSALTGENVLTPVADDTNNPRPV